MPDVCSAIAPKLKEDKEEDKNKGRVKVFACILFHDIFLSINLKDLPLRQSHYALSSLGAHVQKAHGQTICELLS